MPRPASHLQPPYKRPHCLTNSHFTTLATQIPSPRSNPSAARKRRTQPSPPTDLPPVPLLVVLISGRNCSPVLLGLQSSRVWLCRYARGLAASQILVIKLESIQRKQRQGLRHPDALSLFYFTSYLFVTLYVDLALIVASPHLSKFM
jgi:hypothetical protein